VALAEGEEEAMGEEHQHTWSPYLPEGNRGDLDEEELEFDEEEVKYRIFLASPEGRRGLELAKEQDPDFVAMVTEWCTNCPLRRGMKYEVEEEVKMEEEELLLLHLHHQEMEEGWWDSTEAEEGEVEEEEEGEEGEGETVLKAEECMNVDEEAATIKTQTEQSSTKCNIQPTFWRPWEVQEKVKEELLLPLLLLPPPPPPPTEVAEVEEPVEVHEKSEKPRTVWSEATHTFLSSSPVTPPLLQTPRRPGGEVRVGSPKTVGRSGRGKLRSLRRLLDFHSKLERTCGLPPSRLEQEQRSRGRVEGGSRVPVSHRRGVDGLTTFPYTPWTGGLGSTPFKTTLLQSPLVPGGVGGGGPRVLCWGCRASL